MDILEFKGEYRWLSNFWPSKVTFDGVCYPSVENAYQAAKTIYIPQREQFKNCTAGQARRLGRSNVKVRDDWHDVKVDIMRSLIEQKFAPGTELAEKLKSTGDGQLVEGNTWGDIFWGACHGHGHNVLGKLLMQQRSLLQKDSFPIN